MSDDIPELEIVEFDAVDVLAQMNGASLCETRRTLVSILTDLVYRISTDA